MSAINYKNQWSSQKAAYQEALKYVYGRQQGNITSFRTPWAKMNEAGVNGLEWHSLTVIAGRPGSGKTLTKDQIVREAYNNNKGQTMRFLEFQLEMVARASKVREFCAILGKPYKYVCSADQKDRLAKEDLNRLHEYSKEATGINRYPVDIVENPCTVDTFIKIVEAYMEEHAQEIDGKKVYVNTVITADHSYLFKKAKGQSKTDMLYALGEALTLLKRKFPIAFIVLSQLGRNIESPERNENGKYGNYILDTDILGGDALLQHADMLIGLNRPAIKFIDYYGPDRYIIADDTVLVWHFLKCRSGDTRMSFMKAEFDKMCVVETGTPGVQQKKVSTITI